MTKKNTSVWTFTISTVIVSNHNPLDLDWKDIVEHIENAPPSATTYECDEVLRFEHERDAKAFRDAVHLGVLIMKDDR